MRRQLQILTEWAERPGVFRAVAAIVIAAGLALRIAWVHAGRVAATNSEMLGVSRAFAATGHLADAYGPGTGLTAHVTPAMPLIAGTVYRLFGPTSSTSEIVLMALALGFVGLSLWAIDRAMARLGSPAIARLAALTVFVLAPLNLQMEMRDFRVWEGGVAAAGLACVLAYVLRRDADARTPGWREALLLAAAGGVMALFSPPAALAIYGMLGLLAWRRHGFLAMIPAAVLSAVLLAAISYPWAMRNEAVFGEKVWSRTNFGFNFALGYHDAAVSPKDPKTVFVNRLREVDPYTSKQALATLKGMGGEQAYSKYWSAQTKAWIAAHPAQSVKIAVRHIVEFYFPPRWFWSIYSDTASALAPRQALIWAITVLAGVCVAARLAARDWRYLYVLAALTLPALPYILAQPVLRYRYPIVALMTYLAAEIVWRIVARLVGQSSARVAAAPSPVET